MSQTNGNNRRAKANVDLLMVGGLLMGWFALQAFVLPGLGVSTWGPTSCGPSSAPSTASQAASIPVTIPVSERETQSVPVDNVEIDGDSATVGTESAAGGLDHLSVPHGSAEAGPAPNDELEPGEVPESGNQ